MLADFTNRIDTASPAMVAALHTALIAEERARLTEDFAYFCQQAWNALYPTTDLTWSWHYDYIAEYLQLIRSRKLRRLIVNVPPRTSKSTFLTIFFPVWTWIENPQHNFLCASYSRDLATDHSIGRRNLIQLPWFQCYFGNRFKLSADRNLSTQFTNNANGQMIATSTGSGAEGRGGDTAILDDPMSNQQALSDTERSSANAWVQDTLKQRLNNPRTGAIILIMQRLHELDTTGFVIDKDGKDAWTHLVIPLVEEEDKDYVFPVTGRVHYRAKGDILQPERFSPEVVAEKQRSRLVYAGQYQQRPAPLEGNLIKRAEVMYYGGRDPLTAELDEPLPELGKVANPVFNRMLISVDCSFKDLKTSDYVAIGVIGVRGRKRYILNIVNAHLDLDGTVKEIKNQRRMYPQASAILVEDKANGSAVIQKLKADLPGVIEIEPQGGKIARIFAVSPEWQARDWYVDRNAAWAEPFVQQITMFPTAANDDMADMMSQAGIWLGGSNGIWSRLS